MKSKLNLLLAAVLFVGLIGWAGYGRAQKESLEKQQWEYLVFSPVVGGRSLQDQLNHLGEMGWELVSTQPARSGGVELVAGEPSFSTIFYFKRIK